MIVLLHLAQCNICYRPGHERAIGLRKIVCMHRLVPLVLYGLAIWVISKPTTGFAQDSSSLLTLEQAVAAAITNNQSVQSSMIDQDIAAANYRQTNAMFLPQLNFSYSAMRTNNPLNAFGFKLQQQAITAADFNPATLNNPSGTSNINTKLELQQPLVNLDMLYQRKAAAIQQQIYGQQLKRTKEYISFETTQAYLQLQLAYDAVKVMEDALQTAKAVQKFTDDRFQQGFLQQSDLLNVQVQVAGVESNLAKARSSISNAADYLSVLMGLPVGKTYRLAATPSEDVLLTGSDTSGVSAQRADLRAMSLTLYAKSQSIEATKKSLLPRLNAFGSYQYNDNSLFGFKANAWLAGLQLSWDIFNGNRTRNQIAVQQLEQKKMAVDLSLQKNKSDLELQKTRRDVIDAQFEISRQKTAVAQAAEALRILQNRYVQGLVSTTDITLATTQLAQQQLGLAQAVFRQQLSRAYLQFITAQ